MDIEGWLLNFSPDERELAATLATEILVYSDRHVDALLVDSLRRLSSGIGPFDDTAGSLRAAWNTFVDRMMVVPVVHPQRGAESGYLIAHKARRLLEIPDAQVVAHEPALDRLRYLPEQPVVFVDDILITGDQLISFLELPRQLPGGAHMTYAQLLSERRGPSHVALLIASTFGLRRVRDRFPTLRISAATQIDETMCIARPECSLLSQPVLEDVRRMIVTVSERAGIPITGPMGPFGYGGLGLMLALEHNVPDTTIPLFWWTRNGWHPLIQRA